MAGVPARQIGWVCECGQVLEKNGDILACPDCGRKYTEENGSLVEFFGESR